MEELNELQKECSPQELKHRKMASQPQQDKNWNDLTIFFNQDQFTIIKQWKKVHRFLFKHGVYVLVVFLGLVSTYILTTLPQELKTFIQDNTWNKEHSAAQEGSENGQIPEIPGLELDILYGKLTLEKNILSSSSNLVKYQNIVLPKNFEISTTSSFFDIKKFEKKQSTPSDISKLVQQLIITPNKNSNLPNNKILTLSKGIIDDFNLECLEEMKISDAICNKFLHNFLTNGMLYNIQKYPEDLQSLQTSLKKRKKESLQFCTLIYEHTKYYKQNADVLNKIIGGCPPAQQQQYKTLSDFITVDQEIRNGIISNAIYTNPDINAYKLLSIQQNLYASLQGNPNKNYITNYLTYSQELISKTDRLAPVYKDILYWVNTNILLPKLETLTSNTITKAEINQIITQITLLNKGDPMWVVWRNKGLENFVTTAGLVQYRTIGTVETTTKDISELINPILELTNSLRVQRYTPTDDTTVDFQLEIFSPQILSVFGETIKAKITMFRKGDMLYIQNLTLINLSDLTLYLQNAIQGTNTTLQQLIGMINENISFYYQPPQPLQPQKSLCETVNEDISDASIVSCTPTVIDLSKNGINYTFHINNEVLVDITISDKTLEQQIKDRLTSLLITKSNTLAYIREILDIGDTTNSNKSSEQYTEQRVLINERMKRYLNVIPKIQNIDENTFIVTFKIGEVTLQGSYDISTHIISTLSFVIDENSTLLIRGFMLPLNEENRGTLAEFLNNPRLYLRLFNQAAFDKYERMLNAKK